MSLRQKAKKLTFPKGQNRIGACQKSRRPVKGRLLIMNKTIKFIIIFFIVAAAALAGYFLFLKKIQKKSSPGEEYNWVKIDYDYSPRDYIEEYIKNDSAAKGMLPVHIKNYGQDKKMLRKFVGKQFARPTQARLRMMYPGMSDWQLIDLKYKTESGREVTQTILYIYLDGDWRVGDRGELQNRSR